MSTRINTNVTAFDAARNLSLNSDKLSKNIQHLSSGMRINSAADDAAGLVISQNMKAQLTGINQATANTNDATNMVKTAEGALNEVQNLLMSMRQLAVHASNLGVNSAQDVAADQTQLSSALSSIDRIAGTTQFSNKKLLDGSATSATTTTAGSASVSAGATFNLVAGGSWGASNNYTYGSNSLTASTQAVETYAVSNAATVNLSNTSGASQTLFSGKVVINGATYSLTAPTTATNSPNQSLAQLNTAIQSSGYQAGFSSATGNLTFTNNVGGPQGSTPTFDLSGLTVGTAGELTTQTGTSTGANNAVVTSTMASGSNLLASQATSSTNVMLTGKVTITNATATGGTSTTAAEVFDFGNGTTLAQANNILKGTAADSAGNTHNVDMKVTTDGSNNLVFTTLHNDATGATTAAADVVVQGDTTGAHTFQSFNTNTVASSGTFTDGANGQMILSDGNAAHNQTSSATQIVGSTSYFTFSNGTVLSSSVANPLGSGTTALTGTLTPTVGTSSKGNDLQFQIGANGGQTVSQSIASVKSDQLGKGAASYVDASGNTQSVLTDSLKDINLSTFKGAQDAIAVIDKAISDISTVRAGLGAFQSNVLQSNANSLGIANENLQASQSTIVDTDLSAEIVDYTKNQILVQAATSALGQANQAPQGILKLLQ